MSALHIRFAQSSDLKFLLDLERACFPATRQSSERSLRNSIRSESQFVLIAESTDAEPVFMGAAVLIAYKQVLRLYSIAVSPEHRGQGVGESLVKRAIETGKLEGFTRISLEAEKSNEALRRWYRKLGFEARDELPDYYEPGSHAVRMFYSADEPNHSGSLNIIVVDSARKWPGRTDGIDIVSARDYLSLERFRNAECFNVLNLCASYKTLSLGYYVSLMAAARNHRVVPSVMTIKDISNLPVGQSVIDEYREFIDRKLKTVQETNFEVNIVLGHCVESAHGELAKRLYTLFEIPCFTIGFEKKREWKLRKLVNLNPASVAQTHPDLMDAAIQSYFGKKRYRRTRLKNFKYDLAILVNPEEKTPPSDSEALEKFRRAAEAIGFMTEFVTKLDYRRLCEFDALFIRETTAIENHTYKFARHAHTEGLVVIDDPWSILRCSNKIFLHERLARARIKQPRSWLLTKNAITPKLLDSLVFPLVLKLPESSFSQGVYRVENSAELESKLKQMFEAGDLVIAQEFLKSSFDWRIGVLDRMPLFACKYYMARDHWQIYNWKESANSDFTGASECIPVNQVPEPILKMAVKASSLIGDGLYGVDLKEIDGQARIIEINDNPNIDGGVEDALLGDELYLRVMRSFYNRIERERFQPRYLQ